MKRTIIFKDADRNKVVFECEITERNGYPEFTASGEYCGSLGQCFGSVKPATENQSKLIDLWRKWHLNGMKAGTDKQMELTNGLNYDETMIKLTSIDRKTGKESFFNYDNLTKIIERWKTEIKDLNDWFVNGSDRLMAETWHKFKLTDYETREDYYNKTLREYNKQLNDAEEALKSTMLYDIDPRDNVKLYRYGSAWLRKDLPENFEGELNNLLDKIEAEEEETKERKVVKEDIDLFNDFDEPKTALSLALMFELSVNEIEEIKENGDNSWIVQGIDYLAGTDNEMDEAWDNELENYIDECIEMPKGFENYFDREAWKRDARYDGRGHALNRYDGGEEEIQINGTWFYAYRQ
jgi:hypothetical protein